MIGCWIRRRASTSSLAPGHTFRSVTEEVSRIVLTGHTPLGWYFGFMFAGSIVIMLLTAVTWLFLKGVGIWGLDIPVGWGFAIINFVWWIGIGHAGTLISAILLLFKQQWRNSINRFAEAMTIFAVICAGMFPLIHVGRPWLGYWLFPYPNSMSVWPQFRSPAAVGRLRGFDLCHDLRRLLVYRHDPRSGDDARPRAARSSAQFIYGMLALGWRGSVRHWAQYETASLLLAGLATPLVLSVHTVISFDFAVAVLPGWHTTIFPPYFVAGAIYSGFAMVLTLAIPIRKFYHLEDIITLRHLDNMGKVMLATGLIIAYGYAMDVFFAWFSASHWEFFMMWNRDVRPHRLVLLGADHLQYRPAAAALAPQFPGPPRQAVHHVAHHQCRHVVRALCHCRGQPYPRLSAVLLGNIQGNAVGLRHLCRNAGLVYRVILPVCSLLAHDPDVRTQNDAAPGQGQGGSQNHWRQVTDAYARRNLRSTGGV